MPYVSIPDAKRAVGKPVDKDLVDNIHNNLEDLNTRVGTISIAAGSAILVNEPKRKAKDSLPIGSLVFASLDSAQFAAETDGGEWALADGSSVAGSDWAALTGRSVLPDVRGRFLRAKSHSSGNAPTDLTLDSYTADTIASHLHDMSHGHSNSIAATAVATGAHTHGLAKVATATLPLQVYDPITVGQRHYLSTSKSGSTSFDYDFTGTDQAPDRGIVGFTADHNHTINMSGGVTNHSGNTGSTGAAETAPRYVTENVFIKINRAYLGTETRLFVLRVPQQTTLNNILLSPVSQGTSGSLVVDIKKGNTIATATQSIFQSGQLPTLPWNGTSGVTGLTDSNQNTVAAGQFVVVSVTATQAKLREFHLFIGGDY